MQARFASQQTNGGRGKIHPVQRSCLSMFTDHLKKLITNLDQTTVFGHGKQNVTRPPVSQSGLRQKYLLAVIDKFPTKFRMLYQAVIDFQQAPVNSFSNPGLNQPPLQTGATTEISNLNPLF